MASSPSRTFCKFLNHEFTLMDTNLLVVAAVYDRRSQNDFYLCHPWLALLRDCRSYRKHFIVRADVRH
jgi:hypothetical protein